MSWLWTSNSRSMRASLAPIWRLKPTMSVNMIAARRRVSNCLSLSFGMRGIIGQVACGCQIALGFYRRRTANRAGLWLPTSFSNARWALHYCTRRSQSLLHLLTAGRYSMVYGQEKEEQESGVALWVLSRAGAVV